MARKIVMLSPAVIFIGVIAALVLSGVGGAELTEADIEQVKANIASLLEAGNVAGADVAVEGLLAQADSEAKGQAVQQIAGIYKGAEQYEKAISLAEYVVDKWPGADYAVWCQMEVALCNIELGNNTAAQSAVEKLSADYASDVNLPWTLYIIAERYRWGKHYDEAKVLYQQIIDGASESDWALKARLGICRAEALYFVESGGWWLAEQEIARMVSDFAGHADLPQTLRDVAEQYRWAKKYEESQELCKRAERLDAESAAEVEQEPTLQEQEAAILAMMKERKFEEALSDVDKLIADFAGDAGLAEAVYWITKEFEWSKSAAEDRATRYDIPRALYQRISRQFVSSPRASDAEWDYKRLTHRTNILTFIASGNSDQNEIDAAIAAMEADFADRPDLILEGLYWIGREYELYPDGADRARMFYERIAVEFPNIPDEANAATMDAVRAAIDAERRTGKEGQAQETIARFRRHLQGTPRLAYALYWAAVAYRREAAICEQLGTGDAFATACLEKAAGLYTEVTELAADSSLAGKAYFFLGGCYRRLQKFSDALGCYRQVQKNWPASQLEAQCLEGISVCYEQLGEQGRVDSSEADDRIEQVYKELVEKYPDSPQGTEALLKLGWLTFRQNRPAEAISYFEKGLAEFPAENKPEDVLYVLARMYQKTGRNSMTLATYRKLLGVLRDDRAKAEKVKVRIEQLERAGKN